MLSFLTMQSNLIWMMLMLANFPNIVYAENDIAEEVCKDDGTECFKVPTFDKPTLIFECSCFIYGFDSKICADILHLRENVEEQSLSFHHVIDNLTANSNDSMLSRAVRFLALHSHCQNVARTNRQLNFTAISSCPKSWLNHEINQQCIDPGSSLPPIDYKGYFSFVFRNIYCALCHGLTEQIIVDSMIVWKSLFSCNNVPKSKSSVVQSVLGEENCKVNYLMPNLRSDISTEHKQNWVDIMNYECVLCREEIKVGGNISSLNCIVCRYAVIEFTADRDMKLPYDILSVLFKMPTQEENEIFINYGVFKSSEICKDDENYNLYFQKCRKFVCPRGQFALQGRCQVESNVFVSPDSQIYPSNYTSVNVTVSYTGRFPSIHEIVFAMIDPLGISPTFLQRDNYDIAIFQVESDRSISDILNMWSHLTFTASKSMFIQIDLNNMNSSAENSSCALDDFLCIPDPDTFFLNSKPFARVESSGKSYMYPLDNIMYNITIDRINSSFVIHEVCVCEQIVEDVRVNINCSGPLYEYTKDEYRLLHNNHLELVKENLQFNQSQYLIRNNTALVCYDRISLRDLQFFNFDEIQGYVSLTCTSISVLFLVLSIILFTLFKELRNLPGRLTAGLSVFLIIAQSMLFLPNLERSVCKYVAPVTHFSWLSVFFWMSCIAANTIITFHPKLMLSRISWRIKSVFWRYCILAVGIPGIICVLFLILDVTEGNHYHIRYGEVNCNWIGDRYGFILVFFLPVAITLAFNIICFCITLYNIERSLKTSEDVTGRKRDKSRCHMYIRLSSVMGFSWGFGFVAVFAQVNLLWYGFIILNGLQGVFIFLSFSVNARTQTLLTKWFSGTFSSLFKSSDDTPANMFNRQPDGIQRTPQVKNNRYNPEEDVS